MNKHSICAFLGIVSSAAGSFSFVKKIPVEQVSVSASAPLIVRSKSQLPSQLVVEYYDKEQKIKRAKYYLVNNKKHGMYLAYYRDGIVEEQTTYLNGIKNGKSIKYNSSGDAVAQADYVKGTMTRWMAYCATSNTVCSEVRMDGKTITYYSVKEFMPIQNGSSPYLATKGVAVNGRISGTVALSTQQGPLSTSDAGVQGIPQAGIVEPDAFKKIVELKREFEAGHTDETCCGFVMVINYSNATINRDVSAVYYEKYVLNFLTGKINYIDYYKKKDGSYVKAGHQVVE